MFGNRIKETTTTTGTGNLTLAGAATNYRTFNTEYGTNRNFPYVIIDDTNNVWETGYGYLSGSTTLVRDFVLDNSSGGSTALTLSAGTKDVVTGLTAHMRSGAMPGCINLSTRGIQSAHVAQYSNTTTTSGTNKLGLFPFLAPITMDCDSCRFEITATSVASTVTYRVGIYQWVDDGTVGTLLAETADIDLSATGTKTPSFSASVKLYAGEWYIMAFGSESTVTIRAFASGAGEPTPLGMDTTNIRAYRYGTHNLTGGWTALPTNPVIDTFSGVNNKMINVQAMGSLV